jgi:hypothetical protein
LIDPDEDYPALSSNLRRGDCSAETVAAAKCLEGRGKIRDCLARFSRADIGNRL